MIQGKLNKKTGNQKRVQQREEEKRDLYGSHTTGYLFAQIVWKIFRFLLFVCLTFVILYPVLFMVSMAFRQSSDLFDPSVIWIPKKFVFSNFTTTIAAIHYFKVLGNTVLLTTSCSILQIVMCSLIGYGFARFKFKGKNLLLILLLFTIVVPPQLISLPTYFSFQNVDFFGVIQFLSGAPSKISILNSPVSFLVLVIFGQGIRSGLFILIYRQFYMGLPMELENAAMVDGAGFLKTYLRIMQPNAKTITLVVFLFSFVWYWNDYYLTFIYAGGYETLSTVIANLRASFENLQNYTYDIYQMVVMEQASCLLFILPLLILYLFTQKYFTEGIERTGIVG